MAKYLAHIAITLIAIELIALPARANKLCDESRIKGCMEPLQKYLKSPGPFELAALPKGLYPQTFLQVMTEVSYVCGYSYPNILHCMATEMLYCELDFAELFDLHDNLTEYCKSKGHNIIAENTDTCVYSYGCTWALSNVFFGTIRTYPLSSDPPGKEVMCTYAKANSKKCMEMKSEPCSLNNLELNNLKEGVEIAWAALDYYCTPTEDTHSDLIAHPAPANAFCDVGRIKNCMKSLQRYLQNPGPDILARRLCMSSYTKMLSCMGKEFLFCELDFAADSELYDLHNNLTIYCGSKGNDIAPTDNACLYEYTCLGSLDVFFHGGAKLSTHFYDATPTEKELVCKYAKTNAQNCMKMKSQSCSLSEEGRMKVGIQWPEIDAYCNPRDENSDPIPYRRLECIAHKKKCIKPLQEFLDQPGPRTLAGLTEGDARITGDKEVCKYAYNNELQCFGKKLLYCDLSRQLTKEIFYMYKSFTHYCRTHGEKVEESETDATCVKHVTMCMASLEEFLHGHNQSVRLHATDNIVKEKELICKYAIRNIERCLWIKEELCGREVQKGYNLVNGKLRDDFKSYCGIQSGGGASSGQTPPPGDSTEPSQDKGQSYQRDVMTEDLKVCIQALQTGWNLQTDALDSLALYKRLQKFYECTLKSASIVVEDALSNALVSQQQCAATAEPAPTTALSSRTPAS